MQLISQQAPHMQTLANQHVWASMKPGCFSIEDILSLFPHGFSAPANTSSMWNCALPIANLVRDITAQLLRSGDNTPYLGEFDVLVTRGVAFFREVVSKYSRNALD